MTTPVHFTVVINFVLAFIPFVLAFYLFKFSKHRTVLWWLILPVFIAFMPNAAYVLTDIIHLIAAVKSPDISAAYLILVLVPFYIVFLTVNFEFYVVSLQWAQQYIQKLEITWLSKLFIPSMHFLAAIGVYLGRFQRLESTDIIHNPIIVFKDLLLDLTGGSSLLIIIGLFILFYGMYLLFSKINCVVYRKYQACKQPEKGMT